MIQIPVSVGELIDKITILEIKMERMQDETKKKNVCREYELLVGIMKEYRISFPKEQEALKRVNEDLWEIEDKMRRAEATKMFGDSFIEMTRDEYRCNDRRATIKRKINELANSELIEEKEYVQY